MDLLDYIKDRNLALIGNLRSKALVS